MVISKINDVVATSRRVTSSKSGKRIDERIFLTGVPDVKRVEGERFAFHLLRLRDLLHHGAVTKVCVSVISVINNVKKIFKNEPVKTEKVKKVVASLPIILKTPAMQLLGLSSMIFSSLKSATFPQNKVEHGADVKKTGEFRSKSLRFLLYVFVVLSFVNFVHVGYADNLNQYLYQQGIIGQQISANASKNIPILKAIQSAQVQQYGTFTYLLQAKRKNTYQRYQQPLAGSIVFISFSMPESLIIQVLRDAKAHHTPVVLRGLIDNSFKKTAQTLFNLAKQHKGLGGIEINPLWYRIFHIKQVPAFVKVTKPSMCTQNACPSAAYFVVYGNVHISDALSQIQRAEQLHAMEQSHE